MSAQSQIVPQEEFPLPEEMVDMYHRPDGWEQFDPKIGYRKAFCMVKNKYGRTFGPCWPNAGKFLDFSGQTTQTILAEDIVQIAYYRGISEDMV